MPERRAWTATASELLGFLALLLAGGGALAARQAWLPPFVGFRIFLAGLVLFGALTLVLGLIGLARTRAGTGRLGRGRAVVGTLIGAALVLVLLVLASPGRNLPRINDITTDLSDPPRFEAAREQPANRGRDLAYPGESFAAQQRRGYPDLGPLDLEAPPAEAFRDALAAAERLGWTVTTRDPERLRFEANETTSFFRFVDDVVVRIRPRGSGSRVDMRSKSRDGQGDMGANAARIRAFFAELTGLASQ